MGFKMPDISMPHFSRFYFEASDFKQVYTIAKNETVKSVRGKKFLVSMAIIILVYALITLIPIMLGKSYDDIVKNGYGNWISNYLTYVTLFVALIAALIGSVSIVSEYEERTALILFTRPVKKTTIFLGKFVSSFIVCVFMMVIYYILVAITGYYYFNMVSDHYFESLAMCIMYVFAAVGIAFIFSSLFKKGSVAIVSTILTLVAVIPIITMMITGDKTFMLDTAGNSTITCIPEYLNSYNKAIYDVEKYFRDLLNLLNDPTLPEQYHYMIKVTEIVRDTIFKIITPIATPNLVTNTLVMFGWGAASLIASWFLFLRRQF